VTAPAGSVRSLAPRDLMRRFPAGPAVQVGNYLNHQVKTVERLHCLSFASYLIEMLVKGFGEGHYASPNCGVMRNRYFCCEF
jgi:hypothetical protein